MLKRQENKFTMYKSINAFLDENREKVGSIVELANSYTAFNSKCEDIKAKNETKRTVSQGKATSKLKMRKRAIDASVGIAAGLFTLGKKNDDDELSAISDIPRSELEGMRDSELLEVLETLGSMAEARSEQLTSHGITTDKLESYKRAIGSYNDAFGKRVTGVTKRKIAGASIEIHFAEADEILINIDKLISGMQNEDPEFVRQYKDLRVIKHLGLRHRDDEEETTPDTGEQLPAVQNTGPVQTNSPPETGSQ